MEKKAKVFVGISGGVDSSVSLALLKSVGYDVTGCFIKTWQPDFIECTWKDERRDAMRICAKLDVPFMTIDAEQEYKDAVGQYFIDEYKAGRTPNPDVMCNKEVKFGVFLKKALEMGAEYVATGHYAQRKDIDGKARMFKGLDEKKDQTYFLWTLTQDQISKILFPIGHLEKSKVRELAKKYDLFTETKKDSQGVCFLGPIDMKDFLKHYMDVKKGDVLNTKGEVIGEHDGALFFTLGERHGFKITKKGTEDERLYVIERDLDKNTITVSSNPKDQNMITNSTELENVNWIAGEPNSEKTYKARIRYQGALKDCKIEGNKITWLEDQEKGASGQSIVAYDGEECIGGGIII